MLEMMDSGLIITLVDIVSFFDKENIYDVMQTLSEIGVNIKQPESGLNYTKELKYL